MKKVATKSVLAALDQKMSALENLMLKVAAVSIIALGILIFLSVILRSLTSLTIPDETVMAAELMLCILVLPLAFIAANREFIKVEIFTQKLSANWQLLLNLLTDLVTVIAIVPIIYASYFSFMESYESGAYYFGILELRKWPGQLVFLFGYLCLILRIVQLISADLVEIKNSVNSKNIVAKD